MPNQLTVRLTEDLGRALDRAAARMRRKRSEIVRMALDHFLGLSPQAEESPCDRVRGLVGSLETGVPDLAERHRAYLLDSLKNGR